MAFLLLKSSEFSVVHGIPSGFATEATERFHQKTLEESEMSEAEEEGEEESDAWGYIVMEHFNPEISISPES